MPDPYKLQTLFPSADGPQWTDVRTAISLRHADEAIAFCRDHCANIVRRFDFDIDELLFRVIDAEGKTIYTIKVTVTKELS